jgi:hypothetical protein
MLKRYVLLFQKEEPLIHKLNDEQEALLRGFFACFVKPEILREKASSSKALLSLDIGSRQNLLRKDDMYVGDMVTQTAAAANKRNAPLVKDFYRKLQLAYIDCGKYLQKSMPLNNPFLKAVSAIDPAAIRHSLTLRYLKMLPKYVTNVLSADEKASYDGEVHLFQADEQLERLSSGDKQSLSVDKWWYKVLKLNKYPSLCKLVLAILSCFHGPRVESNFNIMGDIIDCRSSRIALPTYNSYQTIKYALRAHKKTAIAYFRKQDFKHDPVDPNLIRNMKSAAKEWKKEKEEKRRSIENKKKGAVCEEIQCSVKEKSERFVREGS